MSVVRFQSEQDLLDALRGLGPAILAVRTAGTAWREAGCPMMDTESVLFMWKVLSSQVVPPNPAQVLENASQMLLAIGFSEAEVEEWMSILLGEEAGLVDAFAVFSDVLNAGDAVEH